MKKLLNFKVDEVEKEEIKRAAESEGRTVGGLIRWLVKKFISDKKRRGGQ